MEQMGTIYVDANTGAIYFVIGVAANMRTPVDDQHSLACARQSLGAYRTRKAGSDHENVVFVAHIVLKWSKEAERPVNFVV